MTTTTSALAAVSSPSLSASSAPGLLAAATAAARPVSLADRVARGFPPLACVRGFRYFSRRRVTFSNVSEAGLDAEVKGKRTLHVRLRVDDGRLAAACTCSARVLGPARCRHVWAALLEADRQGVLGSLRATPRALALVVLDGAQKEKRPAKAAPASARRARAKTRA